MSWVKHFALWFVKEIGVGKSPDVVAETLPRYIENVIQDNFEDRAFLKAEAFRFLSHSFADPINGNEIKEWLWGFVEYAV